MEAAPWRCEAREVEGFFCLWELVVASECVECGEELLTGPDFGHDIAGSVQWEVWAGRVLVELLDHYVVPLGVIRSLDLQEGVPAGGHGGCVAGEEDPIAPILSEGSWHVR